MAKAKLTTDKQNIFARMWCAIKRAFYDLSVKVHGLFRKEGKPVRRRGMHKRKRNRLLFAVCCLAIPLAIFAVFYLYRTLNSFLLAVKTYDTETGKFVYMPLYEWGTNFKKFFLDLKNSEYMGTLVKNSVIVYLLTVLLPVPINLLLSFYVYKKFVGHKFFAVITFLPSIIAGVILVTMFKYMSDFGVPALFAKFGIQTPNFLTDIKWGFWTQIVFLLWSGFASGLIFNVGLMGRISDSQVEAAQLDGIGTLQEFWYITLPLIWPTIAINIAANIAALFSSQGALYTFFGPSAPIEFQTFGYYFFKEIISVGETQYPFASAAGIIFTIVAAPLCLFARWALLRFGWSETTY